MSTYRPLSSQEIQTMEAAGCHCADWSQVQVADGFDATRVRRVSFYGQVRIGALQGVVQLTGGVELPAELTDATIADCTLEDDVRISQVGGCLSSYQVASGAVITDVGTMATSPGATFGNGVELETVNEGGGREVRIFNELSSQFAYVYAMHRYRPRLIEKLEAIVEAYVEQVRADHGSVGRGAVVAHVAHIQDVDIGAYAQVHGAAELKNGTILSEQDAPSKVGSGVVAEDFIIAEGSSVESGAVLSAAFVGQGVQIGKQFSAENSLFFANCEGFHGEACSIFAGPYTVTHHKSTLLIAGIYSFYNAGSGTNQSNHMYKLGPVHQGRVERGSKTGSFSYMLWPSILGPYSVVIGKHLNSFDASELPFSYITDEGGESYLTPGMNMHTVGTIRDVEKWPARDRRGARVKRDLIRFEVYGPYLVRKMIRGEAVMQQLLERTSREVEQVRYKGLLVKRLLLRTGARNYRTAVELYLNERISERAASALDKGSEQLRAALAEPEGGVYSDEWVDLSGLLMARDRMLAIESDIEDGKLSTVGDIQKAFEKAWKAYEDDEWIWVRHVYAERTGKSVDDLTAADIQEMARARDKAQTTAIKKVLADAEKEFDDIASSGYGVDGDPEQRCGDFEAVRGTFENSSFVKDMKGRLQSFSS